MNKENIWNSVSKGDRVQLTKEMWNDAENRPERIPVGTTGVVTHVDDIGTVHVSWSNGSTLGLVKDEDEFTIVEYAMDYSVR